MDEGTPNWRVSEVLWDPMLTQRVVAWEHGYIGMLALLQRHMLITQDEELYWGSLLWRLALEQQRVLAGVACLVEEYPALGTKIATCEQCVAGWAEAPALRGLPFCFTQDKDELDCWFAADLVGANKRYARLIRKAWGLALWHHPLVVQWVGERQALGSGADDKALDPFWRTAPDLARDLPRPRFIRKGEVELAEEVVQRRHKGQSWDDIFDRLQDKDQLLRNEVGEVRHTSKEALRKWAIANDLVEERPPGILQREWREIQQGEAHEIQQMGEIIEKFRTLELTPQPNGGYVAHVHTASGDQIEAQERDGIGALLNLAQCLQNRFPGEQHQQGSDT
jgi:hypothetical protein